MPSLDQQLFSQWTQRQGEDGLRAIIARESSRHCTIFSEVHDQAGLCKVKINCCDFTAESFFLTFFNPVLEYSDNEADLLQPRWHWSSIDQRTAPTQWTGTATSNKQGKGLSWWICSLLWVWWKHELVLMLWSLHPHLLRWLRHLSVLLIFWAV